ncbi:MAG TPA: ATP-binding cassette domain-containing protein [Thermoanaerobaculia bacterium]|nr:ATP-binding cassette domain-containing protein [Thermoanaerobaculia bacterium]
MQPAVEFRDVDVSSSQGTPILRGIDLSVEQGSAVALIGRSGAGKTTALRLVNGLVRASRGSVVVEGKSIERHDLVALRRSIGYIIQAVGLFPHRSVYDNVATVPRLLRWEEARIREEAERLLGELDLPLPIYGRRFPSTLSGGERQRVGIARALIFSPRILLCDEPFGALDPIVRREQQEAFVRSRAQRPTTMLFVTHDLQEAMFVAERIVLFDEGAIVVDLQRDRFAASSNPLVRRFLESARLPQEAS